MKGPAARVLRSIVRRKDKKKNRQILARLGGDIRRCVKCPLHKSRRQAVPGEGCSHARILFIGEAPGKLEDQQGRPFCGRAGQFLDRLLDGSGLKRSEVFITSSVKCRPRNNRLPRSDELQTCYSYWLRRQIEIIDPKVIVLLGKIPVWQLLRVNRSLKELHGRFYRNADRLYQVQYHPAAGMRFPNLGAAMGGILKSSEGSATRRGGEGDVRPMMARQADVSR
ncbi:MAG TPA: uracil-DNA glycosylase [Candidatus Binatia bacterium]|jgi:DNA polymerase|nr:uracil-DNA glycosylase [Candidatus Binatia bacterium]